MKDAKNKTKLMPLKHNKLYFKKLNLKTTDK